MDSAWRGDWWAGDHNDFVFWDSVGVLVGLVTCKYNFNFERNRDCCYTTNWWESRSTS